MFFFNFIQNFPYSVSIKFQPFCLPICLLIERSLQLDFENIVEMFKILSILCVSIFYLLSKSSSHFCMFPQALHNHSIDLLNLLPPPLHIFFEVGHVATLHGIYFLLVIGFDQSILLLGQYYSHKLSVLFILKFLDNILNIRLHILLSKMFGLLFQKVESCLFTYSFFISYICFILSQILNLSNPILHSSKSLILNPLKSITSKCILSRPEINLAISGNFLPQTPHIDHSILIRIVAKIRFFSE